MADRVFLHVGAPKSGTTFLQTILWDNRERLREAGVLIPGRQLFDHNRASIAVRSNGAAEGDAWPRMLEEIRHWQGAAIISNEWLSVSSARAAADAVEDLAPSSVHVVFTARDFVQQVPAAWQESLKSGSAMSLDDFVLALNGTGAKAGRWSWDALDPLLVLERWGRVVPTTQVHLITVPRTGSDPQLLWRRFAAVCGIDADHCELSVARANDALSAEAAALLQRLGPELRQVIGADSNHWSEHYRWIRNYVGHELLVPRAGSRIALRDTQAKELRERALDTVSTLVASGYDVVGDLDELIAPEAPPRGKHPNEVTDAELLALALPVMVAMFERLRRETRQSAKLRRNLRKGLSSVLRRRWRRSRGRAVIARVKSAARGS